MRAASFIGIWMSASCGEWAGDGVVADDKGKGGSTSNVCKKDHDFDQPPVLWADVEGPGRVAMGYVDGADANGILNVTEYFDITNVATGELTRVSSEPSACFATGGHDGFLEGLDPGATYEVTMLAGDGCGNYAYADPIVLTMPVAPDVTPPTISAFAIRCGLAFFTSLPFLSFYGADDQGMAVADFYRQEGDGSWTWLGSDAADSMYFYSSAASGDPRAWSAWTGIGTVGTTATYKATLSDGAGNQSEATATLPIPSCY